MRHLRPGIVLLMALSGILFLVADGPKADAAPGFVSAETQERLPEDLWGTSAVWDGTHAYIFGGGQTLSPPFQASDGILRYDPATDTLERMQAVLPFGLAGTSAVWDGQNYAYIFGGWHGYTWGPGGSGGSGGSGSGEGDTGISLLGTTLNDCAPSTGAILRYEPRTDTLTVLPSWLPEPRTNTAAAWDGRHAYIFGGESGLTLCGDYVDPQSVYDQIVRFDPRTGAVDLLATKLPYAVQAMSAVWDGSQIKLFGGVKGSHHIWATEVSSAIYAFDPASGVLAPAGDLPNATYATSAVWTGLEALVYGPQYGTAIPLLYEPGGFTSSTASGSHFEHHDPDVMLFTSAIWDSKCEYVFGSSDRILVYGPSPECFPSVEAALGILPQRGCDRVPVLFTDQSLASRTKVVSWEWSFGDGGVSHEARPMHVFKRPGDYLVTLKVTGASGITDVVGATVHVEACERSMFPGPEAALAFLADAFAKETRPDADMDGIHDSADNCPAVANQDQADQDQDDVGDFCDDFPRAVGPGMVAQTRRTGVRDHDWDGVADGRDNCPDIANAQQADLDLDGFGDACDMDSDGDGVGGTDNCPQQVNVDQRDADTDGLGDACDGVLAQPRARPDIASPATVEQSQFQILAILPGFLLTLVALLGFGRRLR